MDGTFEAPRYGAGSLADLGPSVLASLGVPGEHDTLGLPPVRRACVLLIDGMGWEALRANRAHAPFLSGLLDGAAPITAAFPTTTATSLTTLGTGCPPGGHGVVGYQVALPGGDRAMNSLRWDPEVDPETWQPRRTVYQRAEAAGVRTAYVADGAFEDSGFTRASARGGRYVPAGDRAALVDAAASVLRSAERCYAFVYHSDLDTAGHLFGVDSPQWRLELGRVDRLAEAVAAALPPDSACYVTADHGMVDISPEGRIDVEGDPDLAAGVRLLTGEARVRQVHALPGARADVLAAWREGLAGRAIVVEREDAIARGWFGPVTPGLAPRIGDVLALAYGDTALVAPEAEPSESRLVGQHGSLTPGEVRVPLLRVAPGT
ncbi:alkaline phosphatase family protein [Marinitenerispora sediminis]|uniref:Alkaline phosphatase family protein n=1 Tax=Marinitenerispora sediminis TaxID=1931232 RepID=A0A368T7A9_9ACTN|nr:alkaline phosphatase family protein [Marinitenerispora sediminis]RCV50663.1 alkaline phosphatase family protein [Marinitenerispora sediminis]RCV56214.1 alkaline phosphatase family protein [Marinitenerispora sediminis]RCV59445.1 alkaline phosphatase family protein [Marinitenerispora sediminis]